jgi:hypothetical protein
VILRWLPDSSMMAYMIRKTPMDLPVGAISGLGGAAEQGLDDSVSLSVFKPRGQRVARTSCP